MVLSLIVFSLRSLDLLSVLFKSSKKNQTFEKLFIQGLVWSFFRVLASLVTDTTTCRVFSYCADILCFSRIYLISYLRFVIAVPRREVLLAGASEPREARGPLARRSATESSDRRPYPWPRWRTSAPMRT